MKDQHQGSMLRRTVFSIWAWLVLGVMVIVWLPVVAIVRVVTAPFDRAHYWTGYVFRRVGVIISKLNPLWSFSVAGTMPSNPRNPYVAVSNHESFVDMLLLCHLPFDMKWLSKSSIYNLPVLGWMLRLSGDVKLKRGVKSSILEAMGECAQHLDRKVSVMIFPEGTRSHDGAMGNFKDGAFRLAIEKQVPILPMAVHGTRTALHKHDWRFGVSKAQAFVMEPVPTVGLTLDDVDTLKQQVRDLIIDRVATMRAAAEAA